MINAYVTQEYNFFVAINTFVNRDDLSIDKVIHLTGTISLVETSYGDFICESFESILEEKPKQYMKVFPLL